MVPDSGKVYLVGAGPGDIGLLTLRGKACLERADVILYDGLANAQILSFGSQADQICVGKHGKSPIWPQSAINDKLVELASAGKQVVRLKGGDPAVFARTAEELQVLSQAQIPFEVVPGITAALAAASYVGIPVTHRDHASAVALVTGRQQDGAKPQDLDWSALAQFPGTLVFYMGVTTAQQWTGSLISAGKPADTPAAIVRRCTWGDQQVIRCKLSEVAGHLTPASKLRPPVIVIVGPVAELGENWGWFAERPLCGCGVLVTRASHQSKRLVSLLRELGASVYHQPLQEVRPVADFGQLDSAIDAAQEGRCQGITFSSSNGVAGWFRRLQHRGLDARAMHGLRIGAVGKATAQSLQEFGLRADVMPESDYSARGLLSELAGSVQGQHWLVTRTHASPDTLKVGIESQGGSVCEVTTYDIAPVETLSAAVQQALEAGQIAYVTVTSSAIARAAHRLLADHVHSVRPLSLSPAVSQQLAELSWPAAATSEKNTLEALCDSLLAHEAQG